MKKVLIAYDGSPGADIAVRDLLRSGLPDRLEARILSIADVWLPCAPGGDESNVSASRDVAAAYEKANEVLREAKKVSIQGARLAHELFPSWTVTNEATADSPAWGILAEAKKWHAHL